MYMYDEKERRSDSESWRWKKVQGVGKRVEKRGYDGGDGGGGSFASYLRCSHSSSFSSRLWALSLSSCFLFSFNSAVASSFSSSTQTPFLRNLRLSHSFTFPALVFCRSGWLSFVFLFLSVFLDFSSESVLLLLLLLLLVTHPLPLSSSRPSPPWAHHHERRRPPPPPYSTISVEYYLSLSGGRSRERTEGEEVENTLTRFQTI